MSSFINLPIELTLKIISFLDYKGLLVCKLVRLPPSPPSRALISPPCTHQVCRSLHALIANSAEFEYKIELALAGCEDGPRSELSYATRLERVKEYQAAWKEVNWRSEQVVPMLMGGVWELYGGVLAQARGRETLVFKQIPSEIKGIEEKDWECHVGFNIRDFGMDPSQDLLVCIERPQEG